MFCVTRVNTARVKDCKNLSYLPGKGKANFCHVLSQRKRLPYGTTPLHRSITQRTACQMPRVMFQLVASASQRRIDAGHASVPTDVAQRMHATDDPTLKAIAYGIAR